MESPKSAKASTTIGASEIMAVYPASTKKGQQGDVTKSKFEESPTGLVALSKPAFDKIVAERDTFLAQLREANKIIDKLRKEVNTPAPTVNVDIAEPARKSTQASSAKSVLTQISQLTIVLGRTTPSCQNLCPITCDASAAGVRATYQTRTATIAANA